MNIESKELRWELKREGRAVLDGITAEFLEGGFYGIIGPNGSGKTSFLRHLLRFLKVGSGKIWLGDRELSEYGRKELARQVAFVPQNVQADVEFSVFQMVQMGRNPYLGRFAFFGREDQEKVEEALRFTSCSVLRDRRFSQLSGGEAQRVLIARAVAQDTPWILLDEPVSGLDVRYQMEMMRLLDWLNRERKKSVIVVLHDLNLAARFCSHLVLMKGGKIVALVEIQKVMDLELLQEVYGIAFLRVEDKGSGRCFYVPK